MSPARKARLHLEAAGLHVMRGVLRLVPLRWCAVPGRLLGALLYHGLRYKRRLTLENLEAAFGADTTATERRRLASACYRHFGGVITEFLSLPRLRRDELAPRLTIENPEVLDEALAERRGVLLVMGHLGNWEFMGAAMAAGGYPFTAYVGAQHNTFADASINAIRQSSGMEIVPKQSAMRGMLRALKRGRIVAILPDQHYSGNKHIVRFFGRMVSAAPGPASLVRLSGAPLVFAETWRVGTLRYRTRLHALTVPASSGNAEMDLLHLSQVISDAVEGAVRRHPAQYFWMHRRWRNPPRPERLSEANRHFLAGTEPPPAAEPAAPPPEQPAQRPAQRRARAASGR